MISNQDSNGLSSDVSWALFFCLESRIRLDAQIGRRLAEFRDDVVAIQALHMETEGLFAGGFSTTRVARELSRSDPDGEHWLAAYEFVRQGHGTNTAVSRHPVFSVMLKRKVSFYRASLPPYASLLHPGGAPQWAVSSLLTEAVKKANATEPAETPTVASTSPILARLEADIAALTTKADTFDEIVARLFGEDYKTLSELLTDLPTYA
jgi:hypothetical protein